MGISPKRRILAHVADATGLARIASLACAWRGLLVLNYHRVGLPGDSPFDHGLWSASAEDFDSQVGFLKKNFDVVGLSDLDGLLTRPQRTRGVMITFDDGYRDNYDLAFPALKRHGVPSVFFITTGFLDQRRVAWWDDISWMVKTSSRTTIGPGPGLTESVSWTAGQPDAAIDRLLRTFKKLGGHQTAAFLDHVADQTGTGRCPQSLADEVWMTWDMARDMVRGGMQIGAHTVNHPVLSRLKDDEIRHEVVESRRRLEEVLEVPIDSMSYPVGQRDSFDPRCMAALDAAGYRWAFSYYGGLARPQGNRFDVPRMAVESDCSLPTFRSMTRIPRYVHT